jgi:hypothetical protein
MKHSGGRSRRMVALTVAAAAAAWGGCGDKDLTADLESGNAPSEPSPSGSMRGTSPQHPEGNVPGQARPLSPLSGSMVTSRQPLLRWTPRQTTEVEICADRACDVVLHTFRARDGEGRPQIPLPAGTLYWRVLPSRGPSAAWQMVIPARDSGRSTAWGVVPDYNGDGNADVAVGAPAPGAGSVALSFGAFFRPNVIPDLTIGGGDGFGSAVAAAGDLNGDGFVDLAVASASTPPSVAIYYGGAGGPVPGPTLYPGSVTGFGTTIASAGDFNRDGYGDLVVGGRELAQVYQGSADGVRTIPALSIVAPALSGAAPDASIVQGPADVNGDGAPDLFVGGGIFHGTGTGFEAAPDVVLGLLGSFAGDSNGDGFTDFAAGNLLAGSPGGIDPAHGLLILAGEFVFAAAGDLDADGYSDVTTAITPLLGAPERERIYFGAPTSCGSTGCRPFSPLIIPGHDQAGNNLSVLIVAAGDVNGDGGDDLVVATPDSGTVALYLGADARELPLNFAFPIWTGAAGSFGSSVTGLFGTAPPGF